MRRHLLAFTVLLTAPLAAQAPDSAAIEAAIAAGIKEKAAPQYRLGAEMTGLAGTVCRGAAREGSCAFTVEASGPLGRVQQAAAEAAKQYRSFSLDAVSADMQAPELVVRATPAPPLVQRGRVTSAAPAATHVVLMPVSRRGEPAATAVQPIATEIFAVEWSNLLGGERSGTGIVARFALDALPEGDFEIVVVTDGAEARYPVQRKHRPLLR